MTQNTFIELYQTTEKNATEFIGHVVEGHNYTVNYCGGGIYTRHMWDGDTGEIYKYQIIVHIAPDKLLINEWCALDGDMVCVWYTDDTKLIEE